MSASWVLSLAITGAAVGASSDVNYFGTWTSGLTYPARVAPAPGGGVYVTDPPMKQVVALDSTGTLVASFPITQGPVGIAVHGDGRVFLSRMDGVVGVYSSAFASQGTVNPAPFAFNGPNDLAMDSATNELYAVDSESHRVLVFTESAPGTWTLARSWGIEGTNLGQFTSPQAIAVDSELNHVIVTDTDNFRIQVFDTTGIMLFKFGYRLLYLPSEDVAWVARSEGVAVDGCGNIYLADALMGTIRVFSSAGGELDTAHLPAVGYGTGSGQLRVPGDISIDDTGKLFVANTNNGSVEVFTVVCSSAVASADSSSGRRSAKSAPVDRPLSVTDPRLTEKQRIRLTTPDNPADIVPWIEANEYNADFDLNRDTVVDMTDLELAVAEFGVGTVEDFVAMHGNTAAHPALEPPHILDLPDRCGRCHSMDGAPGGGMLTAAGQENLCQSCHSAGKIAGGAWIGPSSLENSHPWGVSVDDMNLNPQSELASHLDNGNVRCGTCHEPHESIDGRNYIRLGPLYEQLMVTVTGLVPPAPRPMTVMNPTLCSECHTDIVDQWNVAGHSHEDADPFLHYDWAASNRASCRRCHSGYGYEDFAGGVAEAQQRGNLRPIDCLVCHSTHGAAQSESLLRVYDDVSIPNTPPLTLTGLGPGATCVACHNGRRQPPIPNPPGVTTIHYLSGGVMLEGINGVTLFDGTNYGLTNSNHVTNAGIDCTVCHMAPGPSTGPGVGLVGGHTFRVKDHDTGFENVGNTCATSACHPGLTTINRTANGDYDGDGTTEGVQDETRGLLDLLEAALNAAGANRLFDPVTEQPSNPYWATSLCVGGSRDGEPCTGTTAPFNCPGGTCTASVLPTELATVEDAIWNWEYVDNSGDFGVKNTGYAIGLLQIAYKGVTNNPVPGAAYRYSPAP